jgi:hypothetical protein
MDGVTTEQAGDFYRAAAHFYRQSPWRSVAEGETIKVECSQLEGGPWYAIILGKKSRLRGLMLFAEASGLVAEPFIEGHSTRCRATAPLAGPRPDVDLTRLDPDPPRPRGDLGPEKLPRDDFTWARNEA